jgi:hypothetical protein
MRVAQSAWIKFAALLLPNVGTASGTDHAISLMTLTLISFTCISQHTKGQTTLCPVCRTQLGESDVFPNYARSINY